MIEALDLEQVQCRLDVFRWALLARMRHQMQVEFAAACNHTDKLLGRVAQLASVALENAQRFEEVEAFNTELERKVTTIDPAYAAVVGVGALNVMVIGDPGG